MLHKIKELVSDYDSLEVFASSGSLRIGLPCSPLSLIFTEIPSGDVFMSLHCAALRIFDGDRTDLHDVYSWLVAAVLRATGVCSMTLIGIEHPASGIPAELYGRHLIPEQSKGYLLTPDDQGLGIAGGMLAELTFIEDLMHTQVAFWHPSREALAEDGYDSGWHESRKWAEQLASHLGNRASPEDIHTYRPSSDWFYYRTIDGTVAVVESEGIVDILRAAGSDAGEEVAGINGYLYTGGPFHNFVPRDALEIADRILVQDGALTKSTGPASQATVIPLENGVILAKNNRAVLLNCDTGVTGFARERALVLERNRFEQERLFPPSEFVWAEEIEGGRFERLIYDLLECEPGVREVRAVGASRERDGGRDLIASWVTPPRTDGSIPKGDSPVRERRVIVQCKARKRSVGRSDLGSGVLDTLFMYHGEGYFLAVSSQPAAAAIDLLDEVERRGDYFTGWWGRTEIEQRLRKNPQVLKRYVDIVRPVP